MTQRSRVRLGATVAAFSLALVGCGEDDSSSATEKAVDTVAGPSKVEMKGNTELDRAAYSLVRVQSQKYADYEIEGQTVRLLVRDGVALAGSECTIVTAATSADYPDASFVVVEPNGNETPC